MPVDGYQHVIGGAGFGRWIERVDQNEAGGRVDRERGNLVLPFVVPRRPPAQSWRELLDAEKVLAVAPAVAERVEAPVHERGEGALPPGVEEVRVRGVLTAGRKRHAGAAGDRIAEDERDRGSGNRMRRGARAAHGVRHVALMVGGVAVLPVPAARE